MIRRKPGRVIAGTSAVLLLVVGCSTQPSTHTPFPPTETPAPTNTSLPEISPEIEVIFNGDGCSLTGPSEISVGELTAIFIDNRDMRAELWLVNMDEGYTLQDHLDGQSEPGEWYPKPSWVHYDRRVALDIEELNGQRVSTSVWELDKVGEHTIACYVPRPQMMWFIGPLWVTESSPD